MTSEENHALLVARIKRRLRDLGLNETKASVDAGLSKSGIRNILEGKSVSPRWATVKKIATVLKTTADWLLAEDPAAPLVEAEAPDQKSGETDTPQFFSHTDPLPLFESAEGGLEGAMIVDPAAIDWLPRPHILEDVEAAYAIVIRGDSMVPAFRPGDRAWVDPSLPMAAGEDHIFRSEDPVTGEWRALIKELFSWTRSEWTVMQHNPPRQFTLPRPRWRCHRVVGKFSRK